MGIPRRQQLPLTLDAMGIPSHLQTPLCVDTNINYELDSAMFPGLNQPGYTQQPVLMIAGQYSGSSVRNAERRGYRQTSEPVGHFRATQKQPECDRNVASKYILPSSNDKRLNPREDDALDIMDVNPSDLVCGLKDGAEYLRLVEDVVQGVPSSEELQYTQGPICISDSPPSSPTPHYHPTLGLGVNHVASSHPTRGGRQPTKSRFTKDSETSHLRFNGRQTSNSGDTFKQSLNERLMDDRLHCPSSRITHVQSVPQQVQRFNSSVLPLNAVSHSVNSSMHSVNPSLYSMYHEARGVAPHSVNPVSHLASQESHSVNHSFHSAKKEQYYVNQAKRPMNQLPHSMNQATRPMNQLPHSVNQVQHSMNQLSHSVNQVQHPMNQLSYSVNQATLPIQSQHGASTSRQSSFCPGDNYSVLSDATGAGFISTGYASNMMSDASRKRKHVDASTDFQKRTCFNSEFVKCWKNQPIRVI